MSKRLFCIVLVVVMIFAMSIAGCIKSETDSGVKESSKNTSAPAADDKSAAAEEHEGYTLPIVKEPITLKYLSRESETPGASLMNNNALLWKEFEKDTGIKIEFDAKPTDELQEVVQLRLAAKQDVPDIVVIPGTQEGIYLSKYYFDGAIIRLNEYIDKYATNMLSIFEQYPEYKQGLTLPDGSIVSVGSMEPSKYTASAQIIRQDWLDRLNLEMPKNPDDLLNVAKAFMSNDMNNNNEADEIGMSGYSNQWKELGHAWGIHYVIGGGWALRNGKVVYEPVTEEYQDFLRYLKKCVQEGVFPADWETVDKKTHQARVINGQVGIEVRGRSSTIISYLDSNNSMKQNNPDAEWKIIPPLEGPYGKGIMVKEPIAERWRTICVTSANKYPAETVKWLDYTIFSEAGQIYEKYGIKGLTYNIENGKIVKIPSAQEIIENKPMDDGSWLGRGYLVQIITDKDQEDGFSHIIPDPDNHPLIQDLKKNLWPIIEEPFIPPIPTVDEGNRVSNLLADIQTHVDEMFYTFIKGEADIEADFEKYVNNLKSAGLDEVIAIYQKGYDAMMK